MLTILQFPSNKKLDMCVLMMSSSIQNFAVVALVVVGYFLKVTLALGTTTLRQAELQHEDQWWEKIGEIQPSA